MIKNMELGGEKEGLLRGSLTSVLGVVGRGREGEALWIWAGELEDCREPSL